VTGVIQMPAVLLAEWTKIRTVRSTAWTMLLTVALSAGLAEVAGLSFRASFATMTPAERHAYDPLFATFYSLTVGQLALAAFGVLAIGSEYGTGTIRLSLAAVPRRGRLYAGKATAVAVVALAVSVLTVAVTFWTAQAALGRHGTSLEAPGSALAALGACLYLTLICLLGLGLGTLLRSSAMALGILLPVLFLDGQGLGNVPRLNAVLRYFPDEAGMVIMHLADPPGHGRFSRPYGPWAGLALMLAWTAAALLLGYLRLARADA
jgi:ABC-type transport system involved in multi-copper enzyme maturation permease subunit